MDGKRWLSGSVLVLLLASALGCGEVDTPAAEAVIQERYRDRVAAIVARIEGDCRADVLEAATRIADSLIIERARRMQRLAGRPPRPSRPGAPPNRELSQPLPLRPLFPFEIRFDTLLRDSLRQDSLRLDSLRLDSLQSPLQRIQ